MSQLKLIVFLLAIWLPKANFGALTRTQPHSHDITVLFVVCFEGHLELATWLGPKVQPMLGPKTLIGGISTKNKCNAILPKSNTIV